MSKYIIELDDRIKLVTSVGVTENGVVYTTSDYVHNLEELNSDYINEHYGELQDEAYQRGINDGSLDVKQRVEGAYQRGLAEGKKAFDLLDAERDAEYQRGHDDGYEAGCATAFKPVSDAEYQRGLEDAWEAARKIVCDEGIDMNTLCTIFGRGCSDSIIRDYSASEAIAKLKAYENKHSDRIEVGDEVIDKDGDTTIVTNIHERLFDGLCSDGSTMSDLFLEDVRKTGRHYDHIGKLLEAIRA